MSARSTLLLVRHGHTISNGAGLHVPMMGWTDLALSSEGLRDARRVALELGHGIRPSVIYSSPLTRALVTASKIREACPAPLRMEPDLREINCGKAEGLSLTEVQKRYPEHWAQNLEQLDTEFRWPDGESYRELRARSVVALRRIATAHSEECVVIVTHAGVISQLVGWLYGLSAARWEPFRPRNGSITELGSEGGHFTMLRFDSLPRAALDETTGPDSASPRSAA